MNYIAIFMATASICFLTIKILSPAAIKANLVDKPGGRKTHTSITPTHGGIAIFIATAISASLLVELDLKMLSLLIAGGAILALGAIDDLIDLCAKKRLLIQTICALLLIYLTDTKITHIGNYWGEDAISLGMLSTPFTVFCLLAGVNAVNMSDGIDGLAGGHILIACTALACLFYSSSVEHLGDLSLILGGACSGFLMLNFRKGPDSKAKVFMGDSGSTFLGFTITWLLIELTQNDNSSSNAPPALAIWLLAIPILDSGTVILKRIYQRKSPFTAGRDHLHHLIMDKGHSVRKTCFTLHACSTAAITLSILIALSAPYPNATLTILFFIILTFVLIFSAIGDKHKESNRITSIKSRPKTSIGTDTPTHEVV